MIHKSMGQTWWAGFSGPTSSLGPALAQTGRAQATLVGPYLQKCRGILLSYAEQDLKLGGLIWGLVLPLLVWPFLWLCWPSLEMDPPSLMPPRRRPISVGPALGMELNAECAISVEGGLRLRAALVAGPLGPGRLCGHQR